MRTAAGEVEGREKAGELLEELVPRLREIRDGALGRIAAAREEAREKIHRAEGLAEELERVEANIEDLRAENEGLPVLHSRAVLDDDVDEELRLKDRAQEIRERVPELEERRDSLQAELSRLLPSRGPNTPPHGYDASILHTGGVAVFAHAEKAATERLRKGLIEAVNDTADAVLKEWEDTRAHAGWMSDSRDSDLRALGREAPGRNGT